MNTPVPVILISGFLGAGKTTFINTLIKRNPDKKISLILNEFGNVKLESEFIEKKGIGLISELSNGCLCCVANVDLPRVINYTLDHAEETEYLVIEASGLSDPDPVRSTLQSDSLSSRIRLDTSVAIVDADNFGNTAPSNPLVLSQIADADFAFISKTKGHSSTELAKLVSRVSSIGLGTKTLLWDDSTDLSIVFDPTFEPKKHEQSPSSSSLHTHYDSYLYTTTHALDLAKLKQVITSLPNTILRVKGLTNIGPDKYLVQRVGNHLDVRLGDSSNKAESGSVILLIGTKLDKPAIQKLFENCII